jgi:anti-sigma regulatory factor (Ser/Thr protein kinase)
LNQQITIPATLKAVSEFVTDLETVLADLPVDVKTGITLSVQELGVNIVRHAFAGEAGEIQISLERNTDSLRITCVDDAPNAFQVPDSIKAPDPLELPEHGMGMFIIHQSFDEVAYDRLATGNRWTLEKRLK